jgi:glycerophosphoryl diester phosphodiesterase
VGTLRHAELARLGERPFAHRGLHGGAVVENSRAAFEAAIEGGWGIELDVQTSADGEAFVFHDYELDRLTEGTGPVVGRTSDQLRAIRLRGSGETIPSLAEVLDLIGGRCGLLIEVKSPRQRLAAVCSAVERALEGYSGAAAIMSFNPSVGRWFALRAKERLRGLVVTESGKKGLRGRIERALAFRWSSAEFLAYDIRDLPSAFAARRGVPVFTWTVRTGEERDRAARHADQIIFEDLSRG